MRTSVSAADAGLVEGAAAAPATRPGGAGQRDFVAACAEASCRVCGQRGLEPVLDLGMMPLADGLLSRSQLEEPEARFPLEVAFCAACSLVQILETVPPQVVFGAEYPYYSSFSDALLAHSRANALRLMQRQGLGPESLVVEIASNDGYMLGNFVEAGIPVLGIDPAPGPAKAARERGITTLCEFFTEELAETLASRGRRADVIIANNVLAHVADSNGFVRGIRRLLADDGIASIEVPYVRDLVEHAEFDTIYHEHLCCFSVTAVEHLLRRNGLVLREVERLAIHGGSLRLTAARFGDPGPSVVEMLREEERLGVNRHSFYRQFAGHVERTTGALRDLLWGLKLRGRRLAAYGAAAKGAVMLNTLGAGTELLEFVVDRNVHKQGRYMPGVHLPILPPEALLERQPDYVLILPWNFTDEILAQQAEFRQRGGRFIIPIPEPRIV